LEERKNVCRDLGWEREISTSVDELFKHVGDSLSTFDERSGEYEKWKNVAKILADYKREEKVMERCLESVIKGIIIACNQANAFIFLSSHDCRDEVCAFVAKHGAEGCIMIASAIVDESHTIDDHLKEVCECILNGE
jgi:hypothetical protein